MDDNGSGGIGGNVRGVSCCVVSKIPPGPNISPSSCEFVRRGVCGVA